MKGDKIMEKKQAATSCESCEFYDYDDDYGENVCSVNLDEDEMMRFLTSAYNNCPYFQLNDEYGRARKQI